VSARSARRSETGLTYLELVATAGILVILAGAILPLARVTSTRRKEVELRRALRDIRTAIDRYNASVAQGLIGGTDVKAGSEGFPPDLETLVKGVKQVGAVDRKLKFLRRVPVDPFTTQADWGLRCFQDDFDATSWCGENVWDVFSKSPGVGLDGTKYRDW
jgi:general secretion pathway protein G